MRLDWLASHPDSPIHGTMGGLEAGCTCGKCRGYRKTRDVLGGRASLSDLMASATVDTAEVHIADKGDLVIELPRMGER